MTEPKTRRPFLNALSAEERSAFAAAGRRERYADGETIFRQGDDGGGVVAITAGRVKVSLLGAGGRDVVLQFPGRASCRRARDAVRRPSGRRPSAPSAMSS